MSTISNSENSAPFFKEFKKQASFYLKEKIKTARLALTDVTPAELLTEEATGTNLCSPDTRTLASISRSAFEIDDYTRIVEILHKRLEKFEKRNWRICYNAAIVIEHLLTHGPESVAGEFQCDRDVIKEMERFQHVDEKGFNWGLAARKKSERVLKLLEKGPLLKEERDRARKLSRGIQGFGTETRTSIQWPSSSSLFPGILREKTSLDATTYRRSNSEVCHANQESRFYEDAMKTFSGLTVPDSQASRKENVAPEVEEVQGLNRGGETSPFIDSDVSALRRNSTEEDHPFSATINQSTASQSLLC